VSYLNFPNSYEAEDKILPGIHTQTCVGRRQKSHRSILVIIHVKMVLRLSNTPKKIMEKILFNKESNAFNVRKHSKELTVARIQAELDPAVTELSIFHTFKKWMSAANNWHLQFENSKACRAIFVWFGYLRFFFLFFWWHVPPSLLSGLQDLGW